MMTIILYEQLYKFYCWSNNLSLNTSAARIHQGILKTIIKTHIYITYITTGCPTMHLGIFQTVGICDSVDQMLAHILGVADSQI